MCSGLGIRFLQLRGTLGDHYERISKGGSRPLLSGLRMSFRQSRGCSRFETFAQKTIPYIERRACHYYWKIALKVIDEPNAKSPQRKIIRNVSGLTL